MSAWIEVEGAFASSFEIRFEREKRRNGMRKMWR
jgi:hypothetical protein